MAEGRGASDLHLTAGRPPLVRINGELGPLDHSEVGRQPLSEGDMRTLLYSVMSARQRALYELERELDFALAVESEGKRRRFRVNAYYQKGQMAAALRAINSEIPAAEKLGIPEAILKLTERTQGLLLVVGPTGAGKSTTLACLLDRINRSRACRIITVEDPIEYVYESKLATVDQREVSSDTLTFAAALKYSLRQDPDVILVGEMRDLETISSALTAAETGHLVMATLHANDVAQTVTRIVDTFPSHQQEQIRAQLASALLGVVSQRLLPSKNGGRTAVFEVMLANPAVRTLVREAAGAPSPGQRADYARDFPELAGLGEAINRLFAVLDSRERQLREREALFADLANTMPDVVVVHREDVIFANRAAAALLGLPAEQLVGRPV
ncbi:MAG TPA: PilT/PilU family type 4a pilus ATPase, partial [Myxococcota bacterium]|nr:PilT/PilU family type 4a pilus ATPase [Myxococcota bacterium]